MRIAFNNDPPFFNLIDSMPDIDSIEGLHVETFLEKHGLVADWQDAEGTWGSKDINGIWNGVVGKVGYSMCDVGISIISITRERGSFIDYTHPVGVDSMIWMSKPPQKLPPATNIIRIFDRVTWLLTFISMAATSFMLLVVSFAGLSYGVGTADISAILLTPFRTLYAEPLPAWFDKRGPRAFLSRGFTGNFLLLMWAVLSNFIVMAFLCNIRAMLMKPVFQKPIDTTRDIFITDKIPIVAAAGGFWPEYMRTSSNEWERLAGETGYGYKNSQERNKDLIEKIYIAGSHVLLTEPEFMAFKIQTSEYFKDKDPPIFHISRERIR